MLIYPIRPHFLHCNVWSKVSIDYDAAHSVGSLYHLWR